MTNPPDPGLIDSAGNGIFLATLVAFNVWTRFKQNKKLATSIDSSLDTQIAELEIEIASLKASHTVTQNLVAIHTDKLKDSNIATEALTKKFEQVEKLMPGINQAVELMPRMLDTAEKFQAFFDRAKSGTVKDSTIPDETVGGTVTFKEEKKS